MEIKDLKKLKSLKLLLIILVLEFICLVSLVTYRNFFQKKQPSLLEPMPFLSPTPFLSEEVKLVPKGEMGIKGHETEKGEVYEITGWIIGIQEEPRKIFLGQPETEWEREVFLTDGCLIREAFLNEKKELSHEARDFSDLVPEKTRVMVLCTDSSCEEVEIVTIIERGD